MSNYYYMKLHMEKRSLIRELMKIEYFTRKLPKHKTNSILHWYSNPGVPKREKLAFTQEWVLRHVGIEWAKIFQKSIPIMLTLVFTLSMHFNTTPSFPYSIWNSFLCITLNWNCCKFIFGRGNRRSCWERGKWEHKVQPPPLQPQIAED